MNSAPLSVKAEKPVRWKAFAIGEVCRLINGRAYKQGELLDDGRYRVLRVGNFFTNKHWYFSDLELDDDKYCDDGDLLYAWSASFGPRIWSGEKTIYHYHIWKVEPDRAKVLRHFLFYFFEWDKELIRKEQGAGATMIHVSKGSMEARAIPIPPLDEQKRIVAVLDQAFAALDRARVHAEANLKDARDVFKAKLDAIFKNQAGKESRIDELFEVGSSRRVLKSEWKGEGVPFYRGREITRLALDGRVENELFISEAHYAELAARTGAPSAGDIVITAIGTIGNAHIVRKDDRFYFKDASVLWMRRTSEVSSDYVKFWIRSSSFHDQLERGNGATVDTLTIGKLQGLLIPNPPTGEQMGFAEELKAVEKKTVHLESHYGRKLAALVELKQSLLQKAFSGQLT